jgi:hypothetical protein
MINTSEFDSWLSDIRARSNDSTQKVLVDIIRELESPVKYAAVGGSTYFADALTRAMRLSRTGPKE